MTIDFSQPFRNINGAPLIDQGSDVPMTLGSVAVNALLLNFPNDQTPVDEKVWRWKLALKIHGGSEVTIGLEDAALIKKMIGTAYGPLVVGQAFAMLEKST